MRLYQDSAIGKISNALTESSLLALCFNRFLIYTPNQDNPNDFLHEVLGHHAACLLAIQYA